MDNKFWMIFAKKLESIEFSMYYEATIKGSMEQTGQRNAQLFSGVEKQLSRGDPQRSAISSQTSCCIHRKIGPYTGSAPVAALMDAGVAQG